MKYGSYELIKSNKICAVGYNPENIQAYVTWQFINGYDVNFAEFFETEQEAEESFLNRTESWKKEHGKLFERIKESN